MLAWHITGSSSTRNLVAGNLIGSDKSGLNPLPNAKDGVLIDMGSGNTIGGTTAAARNLISANDVGLLISGASASSNVVQGNYIGTDITGQAPLPNETDGVVINMVPLTVEFAMASYTVSQSAGTATITVVRSSDGVAASVAYATSDGTAKAGVDYVTASGVLSFAAGQSEETFTVSIINTQQVGGSRFLNLTLSNPTNGMVLGNPSMATLTILGYTTSGPTVLSVQPVLTAHGITSVVLTFSEPLDPSRAVNLLNYGYSLQAAGKDQRFGTADDLLFGIASATYNASNDSVTLRMANPIHCNSFIRLTINQSTDNATVPIGVADTSGNLLDGNYDGRPGGVFTATFAQGQHLSYPDGNGNSVSLSLSGGGTMILTRRANGNAWQLSLLNAVPGRTTLTGQVRKAGPGATGLTPIPSIVGTAGVRVLLTNPPFVVADGSGSRSSRINALGLPAFKADDSVLPVATEE